MTNGNIANVVVQPLMIMVFYNQVEMYGTVKTTLLLYFLSPLNYLAL